MVASLPAELHVLSQKLCIDFKGFAETTAGFMAIMSMASGSPLYIGDTGQRKATFSVMHVTVLVIQERPPFTPYLEFKTLFLKQK